MLEKGVRIPSLSFGRWRAGEGSLDFGPVDLPQTVLCDLWIRSGEQEWQIVKGLKFSAGQSVNSLVGVNTLAEFNAETVDVILRPAYIDEWYPYTVYPHDVSPYEVVFHNVSVQRVVSQSTGH